MQETAAASPASPTGNEEDPTGNEEEKAPLRFPGSLFGRLAFGAIRFSPSVRDGLRNLRGWEERLARDEGSARR